MSSQRPSPAELRAGEAAAWGARPAHEDRLRLVSWRPQRKAGSPLRGFATIRLANGLTIRDCPVHVGPNGAWATFPGKPQTDAEGRHRRDVNGKPAYAAFLEWDNRGLHERFSKVVVSAVQRRYPGDLEQG
jgi:hypothetical protein